MSKHKKLDGSWYDLKWKNKRALKSKERKRAARESKMVPLDETGAWPVSAWIVVEVNGAACEVMREEQYLSCTVSEKLLAAGKPLVIGDRVSVNEDSLLVMDRFARHSKLVRMREDRSRRSPFGGEEHVLAANVDVACIVATVADPPFHPRLIDRYLVMCENGGIRPLICINKCDLTRPRPNLNMYEAIGIPVVFVSAITGDGIDNLRQHLSNYWSVLVGHSGVGKSSLINNLIGNEILRTADVSERSKRGRHTTTASSVHDLGENTFMIDTPGIRSWGLWSIDRNSLKDYFPEFFPFSVNCRYRDCTHTTEPDCAIRDAVTAKQASHARYESYIRMFKNLN